MPKRKVFFYVGEDCVRVKNALHIKTKHVIKIEELF
jgi:hypothetical protein